MPKLTAPSMDPGPGKWLSDELHALHRRAGWPSVRELARALGNRVASPSRVHDAFTKPRLPSWGLVELLVEHLASRVPGGAPAQEEVQRFHALWEAAASDIHSATVAGGTVDGVLVLAALGVKQFREALNQLRVNRGMTLSQLSEADDGTGKHLPPSAVSTTLSRSSLPSKSFLVRYLSACGLDAAAQSEWLQVWAMLDGQAPAQNEDAR